VARGFLSTGQCVDAIVRHTRGLADAAEGHLDRPVRHCPGWSVADLVWHLTEVQRFWSLVVAERPAEEPAGAVGPPRPGDEQLVDALRAGVDTMAATLLAADQDAPCWTWGTHRDVGFVTRHQVQEAAVHHWDAMDAVGRAGWEMWPVDAIDAVDEFLVESLPNARWPRPDAEPIGATVWFCPCYADTALCPTWYVSDGAQPGTVAVEVDADDPAEGVVIGSHGDPASLLLWLYGRGSDRDAFPDLDHGSDHRAVLARLRALASTD
jgi:uncharacterized protein (TIGR03083 family)